MLTDSERNSLVSHRLQRAGETLDDAILLFKNDKLLSAVNRVYYAMHHALYALGLKNSFITGRHGQLIGWFNRVYVKSGIVEAGYSRIITRAFEKRMDSDYDNYTVFSSEEVDSMLKDCRNFINCIEELIKQDMI
jgi:uncharacterized protein (UPF0332 family)